MAFYRIHKNTIDGDSFLANTARISEWGSRVITMEKNFVFPPTLETKKSITFKMSADEVTNYLKISDATALFENPKNAELTDFDILNQEPDDWAGYGEYYVRYYSIVSDIINPAGGIFSIPRYKAKNDKYGCLLWFENGVNFYAGYPSRKADQRYYVVFRAFQNPNDTPTPENIGKLRYETTLLNSGDLFDFNAIHVEHNKNGSTFLNAYAGACYLCETSYNGKNYLGIVCVGLDSAGIPTGAIFTGFESDIFGDIAKPTFGEKSQSQGGYRGTFDNSSAGVTMTAIQDVIAPCLARGDVSGFHFYKTNNAGYSTMIESMFDSFSFINWTRSPWESVLGVYNIPYTVLNYSEDVPLRANGAKLEHSGAWIPVKDISQTIYDGLLGSAFINLYWDSYLDFAPYTQIQLYLPFVGLKTIDTNKCMDGFIQIYYRIDAMTGTILYYIYLTDRFNHTEMIYQATGNCAVQLPIAGRSGNTGALVGAVGTTALGIATQNPVAIASGIGTAAIQKQDTDIVADFSGQAGALGCLQAYIVITRLCPSTPENMLQMRGEPSDIYHALSEFSGLTIIDDVHTDGIDSATAAEQAEIERILKSGVII